MYSMEKDMFSYKEEFIPSDQIGESSFLWNFLALIIAIIFCFFLFRII